MTTNKKKDNTVSIAVTDADVPDATTCVNDALLVAMMTPLDDPNEEKCRWGLPTIFWGLSGIAKSARVRQAAAQCGMKAEVVFPAQHLPEDFSGTLLPNPPGSSERASMECTLAAVRRLLHKKNGVLFIDEASGGSPAVQGAMLGMVLDRVIGDQEIPPGVRMLLAANPPMYSAGGFALEAPMANRMCHFQVQTPNPREWTEWLLGQELPQLGSAAVSEEAVKAAWNTNWSYVKGLLSGFMRVRGELIHRQPDANQPQSGYSWPSPRTWEYAGRAMAASRCLELSKSTPIEALFIQACVGVGAAGEFLAWVKAADLPRPEEVLVKGWKPDTRRLDITLAVVNSTTAYVVGLRERAQKLENAAPCWRLLQNLCDVGLSDIAVMSAKTLVRDKLGPFAPGGNAELKKVAGSVINHTDLQPLIDYVTKD
jgi:hypothetical protein